MGTRHPYLDAFIPLVGDAAADDISEAVESYAPFVAHDATDITGRSLDRTFVVHLMVGDGNFAIYHYDPTNTDPEDGDNVILDTDDRPFVKQSIAAAQGPRGRSAGFSYTWSTATSGNPGSGKLLGNNATLASITAINISETDADGNALAAVLATWDDGTSTIRGRVKISDPATPTNFLVLDITGTETDAGTYDTFTASYVSSGGSLTNGLAVYVLFVPKGDKGDTGAGGATGAQGPQSGIRQTYSSTTADADPGAGTFRLNNATPASATAAYLDNLDAGGATVSGLFDLFDDSGSTVKGFIRFEKTTDPTVWAMFQLTGSVVDGTGYRKLTLANGAGSGAFTNGDAFAISFYRTGDPGTIGGSTGSNDNRLLRSDGTGGGTLQASGITVDDSDNVSGMGALSSKTHTAAEDDASNNAVTRTLILKHTTSGSPAAGIGVGLRADVETASGENLEQVGAVDFVATDVANGTEDFDLVVKLMAAGAAMAEVFRISSTGVVTLLATAAKILIHAAGGVTLTGGFRGTSYDNGTVSSGTLTPDAYNSNVQHYTNNGAHTLAPPANTCSIVLDQTNGASAGTVTRSGFTKTSGDTLATTNGNKYRHFITVGQAGSHCHTQAMQ